MRRVNVLLSRNRPLACTGPCPAPVFCPFTSKVLERANRRRTARRLLLGKPAHRFRERLLFTCLSLSPLGLISPRVATEGCISEAANPCDFSGPWRIDFAVSGGFAGIRRGLTLTHQGELSARDEKLQRQVTGRVAKEALNRLSALLTEACPFDVPTRPPPCADCFQYKLTWQANDRKFSMEVNDRNLTESRLREVMDALGDLLDSALAGRLPSSAQDAGRKPEVMS